MMFFVVVLALRFLIKVRFPNDVLISIRQFSQFCADSFPVSYSSLFDLIPSSADSSDIRIMERV